MKEKNKKPLGATELTQTEMMKEQVSHGKKVLSIETDEKGRTKYTFIQKEKNK